MSAFDPYLPQDMTARQPFAMATMSSGVIVHCEAPKWGSGAMLASVRRCPFNARSASGTRMICVATYPFPEGQTGKQVEPSLE